jgi:hypothetical protein
MHINYKLNTDDLDTDFLESVKILFNDKDISISIVDIEKDEDFALGKDIDAGFLSETASKEELNKALYAN